MEKVKLNDQYVNIPLTFKTCYVEGYSSLSDPARAVLSELQEVASFMSILQKKGEIVIRSGNITVTFERFKKYAKLTRLKILKAIQELQEKHILHKNIQGHFILVNKETT